MQNHHQSYYQQSDLAYNYAPQLHPVSSVDNLVARISAIITTLHQSTSERLNTINNSINTLTAQINDVRNESQEQSKHLSASLENSNSVHKLTCKVIATRLDKLDSTIGTSYDRNHKKSILERLDGVSFAVEELLERAKDPEADLHDPNSDVPHNQLIGTSSQGVLPSSSHEVIDLRTPSPPPSVETGSVPSVPRVCEERGTSPLSKGYSDVAVNPKTPTPDRSPSSATRSSAEASTPPDIDSRLSISTSGRYSDSPTLFEDVTSSEIKQPIELTDRDVEMEVYHHEETGAKILEDAGIGPALKDDGVVPDLETDSDEQEEEEEEPSPLIPNPPSPQWLDHDTTPASMSDVQTGNAPDHSTPVCDGEEISPSPIFGPRASPQRPASVSPPESPLPQQQQEEVSSPSPPIPNPPSTKWPNCDTNPASMSQSDAQTWTVPEHSTPVSDVEVEEIVPPLASQQKQACASPFVSPIWRASQQQKEATPFVPNTPSPKRPNRDTTPASMSQPEAQVQTPTVPKHSTPVGNVEEISVPLFVPPASQRKQVCPSPFVSPLRRASASPSVKLIQRTPSQLSVLRREEEEENTEDEEVQRAQEGLKEPKVLQRVEPLILRKEEEEEEEEETHQPKDTPDISPTTEGEYEYVFNSTPTRKDEQNKDELASLSSIISSGPSPAPSPSPPPVHMPSSHDTPSAEELLGCMEDGLSPDKLGDDDGAQLDVDGEMEDEPLFSSAADEYENGDNHADEDANELTPRCQSPVTSPGSPSIHLPRDSSPPPVQSPVAHPPPSLRDSPVAECVDDALPPDNPGCDDFGEGVGADVDDGEGGDDEAPMIQTLDQDDSDGGMGAQPELGVDDPIGAEEAGKGEAAHNPRSPDKDSMSALITEAFASLPELDMAMAEVCKKGKGKERRRRSEVETQRQTRESSPEIVLPRPKSSTKTPGSSTSLSRSRLSKVEQALGNADGKGKGNRVLLYVGVDGPVYDSPPPEDRAVDEEDERGLSPTPAGVDEPALKPFKPKARPQSQRRVPSCTLTTAPAHSEPKRDSPIYVSSRSPSPLPSLSTSSEEDQAALWNSDDSDIIALPAKRKRPKTKTKTKVPDGGGASGQSGGKLKSEVRSPVVVKAGRTLSKEKSISMERWRALKDDVSCVSGAVSSGAGARASSRLSAGSGLMIEPGPSPGADSPSAPSILSKLKSTKASMHNGLSAAVTRVKKKKIEVPSAKEPQNLKPVSGAVAANPAQSVAVTRVKKRKVSEREMMMEPPLKRARQHNGNGSGRDSAGGSIVGVVASGSSSSVQAKGQEPSPKKRGRPAKAKGMKWPVKMTVGEGLQKFVECPKCFRWYHYGCVGILPGNTTIGDFKCPPCRSGGAICALDPLVAAKNAVICSRPDCGKESQPNEYFVAGIVGRKSKVQGGFGRKYQWLLKWDEYPVEEATWEDEESMTDPAKLIDQFNEVARNEGFFPDDDPHSMILLQEAVEAGWTEKEMNAQANV